MSENPYASSATHLVLERAHPQEIVLASRFNRLLARVVDVVLESSFHWIFVSYVPGVSELFSQTVADVSPAPNDEVYGLWSYLVIPDFSIESLAFWLLSIGITFICQAYLLAKYGQTIGKRLLSIKIVNENGYRKPTLSRSFFVRECGIYALNWIPLLALLEILWIFGASRKCLHDYWSRTIVIDALK